jgi:tetratricopeptide repeat protein 8
MATVLLLSQARLDMRKYAARPCINKALCVYLLHHEHNPIKALELASEATTFSRFGDWWWKLQLAKCYYMLNLLREAEVSVF